MPTAAGASVGARRAVIPRRAETCGGDSFSVPRRLRFGKYGEIVDAPTVFSVFGESRPDGRADVPFVGRHASPTLHEQQHGRPIWRRRFDGAIGHPVLIDDRVAF